MSDYNNSERFDAAVFTTSSPNEKISSWPFDWRPLIGDVINVGMYQHVVRKVVFDPEANHVFIYASRFVDTDEVH